MILRPAPDKMRALRLVKEIPSSIQIVDRCKRLNLRTILSISLARRSTPKQQMDRAFGS